MGMNQCLMNFVCIISWYKIQQKIGVQLMPEQGFQIIVLGL